MPVRDSFLPRGRGGTNADEVEGPAEGDDAVSDAKPIDVDRCRFHQGDAEGAPTGLNCSRETSEPSPRPSLTTNIAFFFFERGKCAMRLLKGERERKIDSG